jgi:membrane protein implicated in regulation of membrane protease activity
MADIIQWVATAATICAALVTASNLGARITGYGFAIFLVGSLAWIATALLTDQPALLWTNIVLSLLNLFGIWRWLGRQAKVEEGGATAARASHFTPGEELFPVSRFSGGEVRANGEKAGSCVDAMAGASSGAIRYVVFSDGGVAGVGETLRRADWRQVRVTGDGLALDCDPSGLPEVERDRWPAR